MSLSNWHFFSLIFNHSADQVLIVALKPLFSGFIRCGEVLILVLLINYCSLRRLMHFGSPLELFGSASSYLLELFTRISKRNRTREELICTIDYYLMSVVADPEGLILYSAHSGYE
ncbi:hypothetical protein ACE6H2_001718 [Prunus campanulata]